MIVVGLVSFNSCVLYLSCYIGILVTCAVTCVDFVLCSIVVYCVCYVSVWMCHDSCCLIVLNIVLIYNFYFCGSPRYLGLPLVAVTIHGGCSRVNMLVRLAHDRLLIHLRMMMMWGCSIFQCKLSFLCLVNVV